MVDGGGCSRGFGLAQVLLAEEELAVEVGGLDVVGVGDCELAVRAEVHHCEVFEQLTPDSSSTDNKDFALLKLSCYGSAQIDLKVIEFLRILHMHLRELLLSWYLRQQFFEMEGKQLLNGLELIRNCFDDFLCDNTAEVRR